MSNLTIGRVGIDIHIESVAGWSESGSKVSVSGQTAWGSVSDALTVRQQLNGYVDSSDESFVPVQWADQPEVDGYYRVLSVSIAASVTGAAFGVYDFSVELERVRGFAAPLIESVCVGKPRANIYSLPTQRAVGIPRAAKSYTEYHTTTRTYAAANEPFTRQGSESNVSVYFPSADQTVGQYYLPPENFYDAAATLKTSFPSRVAVGRQIQNTPDSWSLSNGLLEVEPVVGVKQISRSFGPLDQEIFGVRYRMWVTGSFSPWQTVFFRFGRTSVFLDAFGNGGWLTAPHTITVLSNSPEGVTIRLLSTSPSTIAPIMVDLTLRRGARYVAVEWHSVQAGATFSATISNFTSPTAITGGFSKDNGDGSTTVIGSALGPQVLASDYGTLGKDVILVDATQDHMAFCFGLTTTDPADDADAPQGLLKEYFWAGSEKLTVVAR